MTLRVRFDPAAVEELHAASDWYEQARPGLGPDFIAEVWETIEHITEWPASAATIAIPGAAIEVRRSALRRFPYGIVYVVINDTLWIVAVAHGRRRPGYWRERLSD